MTTHTPHHHARHIVKHVHPRKLAQHTLLDTRAWDTQAHAHAMHGYLFPKRNGPCTWLICMLGMYASVRCACCMCMVVTWRSMQIDPWPALQINVATHPHRPCPRGPLQAWGERVWPISWRSALRVGLVGTHADAAISR